MLSTSWRKLFAIVLALGLVFSFTPPPNASAGSITDISVSVSDSTAGATATYTFTFTPATTVEAGGGNGISISFNSPPPQGPEGQQQNVWNLSNVSKGVGSSSFIDEVMPPQSPEGGGTVFGVINDTMTGGSAVTVKVGGVVNPSTAGFYNMSIATISNGQPVDGGWETQTSSVSIGTFTYVKGKVVKDDNGTITPLANRWVNVHTRDWSVNQGANTDSNGIFAVTISTNGTYMVEVGGSGPGDTSTTGFLPPSGVEIEFAGASVDWSADSTKFFKFTRAVKTITGYVKKSDGTAVSGAQVSANKKGAMGMPNFAMTGSDGSYSLPVGGGEWELFVSAGWDPDTNSMKSVDWTFGGKPPTVSFANDQTVETKSQNIDVIKASAKIKGKVVKPDGTALTMAGVGVWSMTNGIGTGGGLDQTGSFEVSVPAGTYEVNVFSNDNDFSVPSGLSATVADDQTVDLGTITMVVKSSVISGKVMDESGNGISGVDVHAFSEGVGGGMPKQTSADGTYSIKVIDGTWMVMAEVGFNSALNYANTQPPRKVTVGKNETLTGINFTLAATNARISGQVVDSNGTLLSSFFGFAFVEGSMGPGSGGPVEGGKFLIKVAAGTYEVGVGSPPGGGYTADERKTVTVAADETKSVTVTAKANDAVITGTLKDDEGADITAMIEIVAENGNGGFQHMLAKGGSYSLNVSAGDWRIGFWDVSGSGYMSDTADENKVTVASGGTATKNLVLKKANATIKGRVTKPDGTAMGMAFVTVDNRSGQKDLDTGKKMMENGVMTDTNGDYSIRVPAGSYFVEAHIPPGQGFINPDRVEVGVGKDSEVTVNLAFKAADAKISGKVTMGGAGQLGAFIWAWAEKGGYSEGRVTGTDGSYEVQVSKGDNWHVGAIMESGSKVYKSAETIVSVVGSSATQDLTLSESALTLPDPVTTTFDATDMKVVNLSDGTSLSIPANSMADSGNITLTATPKAELKSQQNAKPVGIGYDFTAINSSGSAVTNFNNSISVTVPYTEQQLTDMKITEDELSPSYWDEQSGTWRNAGTGAVNKDNDTLTFTTDHFTEFALTAAADSTPPSAPTGVTVTAGNASATVAWTKPTNDFSYAKVYRSTTSGSLGTVVGNNQTGTSYANTGLTNETVYYYTVRAVDAAGNESTNTTQTSGTPSTSASSSSSSGLPTTGAPFIPVIIALTIGAAGLIVIRKSK